MLYLNGFLLSYLKYGDNDCVLHCFTREKGYQSLFVRGIYSKKNKQKAYLQPLSELCFTLYKKPAAGSMLPVSQIELAEGEQAPQNMKANAVVFFIADFLNQVLRNEEINTTIYSEIPLFLQELEHGNYQAHLIFLIRFLEISGVHPLVNGQNYLDPESGNFVATKTHDLFSADLSALWKEILKSPTPYTVTIGPEHRKPLLEGVLVYYHYHFSEFKIPASLEIVQQLF